VLGLAETGDALAVLASAAGRRPSRLRPALRSLLCATRTDWQRFDDLFDAYWLGRGMRRVQQLSGTPGESRSALRRLAEAAVPAQAVAPDHVEHRDGAAEDNPADANGRREGASRSDALAVADFRHIVDPRDVAEVHVLARRLARRMRARTGSL
jgi:uncharacterized protein